MTSIKKMKSNDFPEMFKLGAYAFNSETTAARRARFDYVAEHSERYGYFEGTQLTSQLLATPFKVDFHGVTYDMAGIGCVSSYPEYRGQGGINALMKQLLTDLAEQKVALSYLAPFSYPFYRRYGYEQLFEQIEYTLDARDWPAIPAVPGRVHRKAWEAAKATVQQVYRQKKEYQRGGLVREAWWHEHKFVMEDEYSFAVYENEQGAAEGYVVYQSTAERFTIYEWNGISRNAYLALGRFIGSHNGSSAQFYYKKGFSGEDSSWLLPAPLIDMKLLPFMMGRIVDFQTFISSYPFQTDEQDKVMFLEVVDEYAPWNSGIWQLEIKAGRVLVSKESSLAKTNHNQILSATIQSWTQFFMGYRSGEQLHFHGKVTGDLEQLQVFDQLIPKGMPVLEDYF